MSNNILTEEQLENKKKEARDSEIRQNLKSHCTKIRDGIQKNGTASAHRAIWELFQNAGDLSECAEIKMTIEKNAFIFAHKGKSFTYDSLCSLVKQVSSEEKESDDTVGQYGTGFLATHTFGLKIIINGSMCINQDPPVYVDIDNFKIDRTNFNNIPAFIGDMFIQIEAVNALMDAPQTNQPREWTELIYSLNEERLLKVQNAIDESIKLMPYVLTFNDNIGSCCIEDKNRDFVIKFSKEKLPTSTNDLHLARIWISKNSDSPNPFDCYYLQLHDGESRIILPLESENIVRPIQNIPHLFVHFPLIGSEYLNVSFIFHSHKFTPEEARDNIIVPKNNDAVKDIAERNSKILEEMTHYLWAFLETHVEHWKGTMNMAALPIKDSGYTESETEEFYKDLKKKWVNGFIKLKIIDIEGIRYAMKDEVHPLVLEPNLVEFFSDEENVEYLPTLYTYAKSVALIPIQSELLKWSKIIAEWNLPDNTFYLKIEDIVAYISKNNDDGILLHSMLEMLVKSGYDAFFTDYALLPNRNNELRKREELRDAISITEDLYILVSALDPTICKKFVNTKFADIVKLSPYTRSNLRDELNSSVNAEKNAIHWNEGNLLSADFEYNLIRLCSAFTTQNGDSKRNRIMPIICSFEDLEYKELYIPAWKDDDKSLDIYRQIFITLVENQMRKISTKSTEWVKINFEALSSFVDAARGDDFKNFCTQYAKYPDMNLNLHVPNDLKRDVDLNEDLFKLYLEVFGEDLHDKCVHPDFEKYCDCFNNDEFQNTAHSIAKEIQNKLSGDKYSNVIVLDIIELTEKEGIVGKSWQSLFGDIYNQRESIRYNLGTATERSAINRMMKRRNPNLLEQMADISEREDADQIVLRVQDAIAESEHEAYIKMLGDFVESHIQYYIKSALSDIGVSVENEQGGQDLILSKEGYTNYYIEIKSRWVDKESVVMSQQQFQKAVDNPDNYALISAQMWTFDQNRVQRKENVSLDEMQSRIKVLDNIGYLEADLRRRVDDAFRGKDTDIRAVGTYGVHVPQNVFPASGFGDFIEKLKRYFQTSIS